MLSALLSPLKGWLLAAGGLLLAVVVVMIRQSGADAERLKQAQADIKTEKIVRKARADARSASDDELNARFEKWTRK